MILASRTSALFDTTHFFYVDPDAAIASLASLSWDMRWSDFINSPRRATRLSTKGMSSSRGPPSSARPSDCIDFRAIQRSGVTSCGTIRFKIFPGTCCATFVRYDHAVDTSIPKACARSSAPYPLLSALAAAMKWGCNVTAGGCILPAVYKSNIPHPLTVATLPSIRSNQCPEVT